MMLTTMKKLPFLTALLLLPIMLQADITQVQQLVSSQHFNKALKSVEQILNKTPDNQQALFLKAVTLQQLGRDDDAVTIYKKLIQLAPEQPEPYNNLAVLYAKQGKQIEARKTLLSAINTHKSYATAYKNLGSIYEYMAAQAYQKALSTDTSKVTQHAPLRLTTIQKLKQPVQRVAEKKIPLIKTLPKNKNPVAFQSADKSAEIIKIAKQWSKAWSEQDVSQYLSFYSPAFKPPRGLTRKRWEQERNIRLKKPRFIRVQIQSPTVKMLSDNSALLSFKQNYQSDRFSDAIEKTLLLEKINGDWKISKEFTSS